jgi:hypothetical protein
LEDGVCETVPSHFLETLVESKGDADLTVEAASQSLHARRVPAKFSLQAGIFCKKHMISWSGSSVVKMYDTGGSGY